MVDLRQSQSSIPFVAIWRLAMNLCVVQVLQQAVAAIQTFLEVSTQPAADRTGSGWLQRIRHSYSDTIDILSLALSSCKRSSKFYAVLVLGGYGYRGRLPGSACLLRRRPTHPNHHRQKQCYSLTKIRTWTSAERWLAGSFLSSSHFQPLLLHLTERCVHD